MNPKGYLSLVLHAHLPFVRHPEHPEFLEEDWLFENITESYLPLLAVLNRLVEDGVDFRLTIGLTPTLASMLGDALLRSRYEKHLDRLVELAETECQRLSHHPAFSATARFYLARFKSLRQSYHERLGGELVGAFRRLQDLGRVELIASAATHSFLPHLRPVPTSVRAQVEVGKESYLRAFGCEPAGFWLPECGFYPGLDGLIAEAGLSYVFLEAHALYRGSAWPVHGTYEPAACPSGLAAFPRDPETSQLVWSSVSGYPGDPEYRDFYKDIGFDVPPELIRDSLGPGGLRIATGLKYYRVTGRTPHKTPYVRERALARVEAHAGDFVSRLARRFVTAQLEGRRPLVVAPYDAELFGHWWFEGPEFLDRVLRKIAASNGAIVTVTPSEYLAEYPEARLAMPSESSWGTGGYHEYWLNGANDQFYPRIHEAGRRMEALARRRPHENAPLERALAQAAREALLAQASDWAFIQKAGTTTGYATRRVEEHLRRFEALIELVQGGRLAGPAAEAAALRRLEEIEQQDNLFPWLDYRVFGDLERAAPPVEGEAGVEVVDAGVRRIAFLTAEAAPYAKVGGLADVAGGLPQALAQLGAEVLVVLPAYRSIDRGRHGIQPLLGGLKAWIGGREEAFDLLEARPPHPGVRVLLVDHPGFFDRDGVYGDPATGKEYPDTARRFLFFSRAALEAMRALGMPIDILHCHDYQTAMALALRRLDYRWDSVLQGAAGIFTIHNLGYQGIHGADLLDLAGIERSWFYPGSPFEYFGNVNLLKIGIVLADKVNAVSERYAREICEDPKQGVGLETVLRERGGDLAGILNGMDVVEWNPQADPLIPAPYSAEDLRGKRKAKEELLKALGLDESHLDGVPLVGMVSRLVDQKGFDLIEEGLDRLLALGIDLAVLGTGQPEYHQLLEEAAKRYSGRIGVALKFDNRLAHLIEAGADLFLMPSLYEPCGLNQMYSLRYGTVPVVRHTGGLADTVQDDDRTPGGGVGFSFEPYTAEAMVEALARAVRAYKDRERWLRIIKAGMGVDNSWSRSAKKYLELYRSALARRKKTSDSHNL
ncbi:MAG: DUF1957 domain-containing protein [Planctomycetes bacterium]|nr:DUF1957 domain-containing protein [Planctomycetota bacterium]